MGSLNRSAFAVYALAAIISVHSFAPRSRAQEITAAINGVVTDPSGASVAGAKVTAKDVDRGSVFPTTTNGDGFYIFPRLPIGQYEVRVENSGFSSALQSNIVLQLNQTAKVDFSLRLGDTTQTVEVSSAAPILQTETAQLSTIIDSRTNAQLPLATRNYVQLTLLAPGAVTTNPSGFKNAQTTFNSSRPFINGNREQSSNFLLDGVDNNQPSDNLVAYAPSVDAIQEFNLITQNASAEFGNFIGGITSVSIKSGTNQFHGTAFEFLRNDALNANEWQNNRSGAPINKLRWNMFGGTIGGPIVKDKIFFFADYQGSRYDQPGVATQISVLPTAVRNGNLSAFTTQLVDPALTTVVVSPTGVRSLNRVPFANNQIPVSRFSPVVQKILASGYYPTPVNGGLVSNAFNTSQTSTNSDQGDGKFDWNISANDRFFARYSHSNIDNPTINSNPLTYNRFGNYPIRNGSLDYTHTFSPSLVNDFRAGVNYTLGNNGTTTSTLPNLPSQFGIPGVPSNILPGQSITGYDPSGTSVIGNSAVYTLFADTVIQVSDTAIYTVGTHTLRAGFQANRYRINTFYSGNNGTAGLFTYNGQYSGAGAADFLLGLPSQVGVGNTGGTWGQRANIFGAFIQDTWRVSSRFTVNYGVRYNLNTPLVEVNDRQANFAPFSGEVELAGKSTFYGNNRALYNQYNGLTNFQPRIGLAYQYSPKGVMRASYTLSSYLEGSGTNLRLPLNPPFAVERDVQYSAPNPNNASTLLPGSTLSQGYDPIASKSNPYTAANIKIWDPNIRPAVSNQWNFSIQQQLDNATTLQVGYVGQKNSHLIVAQPYRQGVLLPNGTVQRTAYLSGNPLVYNAITQISGTETNGNQSYNALQTVLARRLSQGLQANLAYTYSKCLTDSIGFYGAGSQTAATSAYVNNLYNRKAEWGNCAWDATHVFSGFASYDLPFGRGRTFGRNMNKVADLVVGGWQVNAIVAIHTGFALTINNDVTDTSGTFQRSNRANCVSPAVIFGDRNSGGSGGGYQWFDPTTFARVPVGSFGNCGVGTVRGPGLSTADMSLNKKFNFTESQNLELRGEFINAFNHPILNAPNRIVNTTNFGVIQSSQGARNIQISLKYNF